MTEWDAGTYVQGLDDDEIDWEPLLIYIREGTVVPVVGRDLLQTEIGGRAVNLYGYLAAVLAHRLRVQGVTLTGAPSDLNLVTLQCLASKQAHRRMYSVANAALRHHDAPDQSGGPRLPVPLPLQRLASMPFPLFLSTTFDSLLLRAVQEERGPDLSPPKSIAFTPRKEPTDIPEFDAGTPSAAPVVYQLFGRASALESDFVLTEDDLLEFLHVLPTVGSALKELFLTLKKANLLLIGCSFPDWLARFFIRAVKNESLLVSQALQVIADNRIQKEHNLVTFLGHCGIQVFRGGAIEFVEKLHAKWRELQTTPDALPRDTEVPEGAIFISYSHGGADEVAALHLYRALRSQKYDVFLDRDRIRAGESWDRFIGASIRRASLFVPVISERALRRDDAYMFKEWRLAIEEARRKSFTRHFLFPVVIDDTDMDHDGIPDEFRAANATVLRDGHVDAAFLEDVQNEIRSLRRRHPAAV